MWLLEKRGFSRCDNYTMECGYLTLPVLFLSLRLVDFNTLLINVYMPTDYGTVDSYNAYLETLSELEGFISNQTFDNLIICGDFNVDFTRANRHCNILSSFMHSFNLVQADINSDVTFTDDFTVFSWPDHVISLNHHAHLIKEVSCEDSVDNFSDHLPLSFSIALP